ncbi:unnamed protein product [Sphenostylis stenocarpa]|uniref:X8 domain-containing protein n=1 Tax=Sphenostylis stenocarpa TaxID=92480 RepID=A0AA86VU78_9FABA|nr:unnamed protein product [Sphenostylis stenocarpa]
MGSKELRFETSRMYEITLKHGDNYSRTVERSLVSFTGLAKAIRLRDEENQEISYEVGTKLDAVPVVNPATPGTANPYPTLNPTTPQASGTIGQTPSTPTTPYMTPINPYTNPTTPKTSPTTNPTTPIMSPLSPTTTTSPTTPTTPATASAGGQWCVAIQSAAESTLKVALDYACGYGADCSAIQPGANCYNPNTLKDHASFAFNDYYQKNPAPTSCAFGGTATLTNKDPSKTFHQTLKPHVAKSYYVVSVNNNMHFSASFQVMGTAAIHRPKLQGGNFLTS